MKRSILPLARRSSGRIRRDGIGIFPGLPRLEGAFLAAGLAIFLIGICLFVHFSREINRFTDARLLEGGGMGGPAIILASPAQVWVGQEATEQPSYRSAQPFTAPPGVVTAPIETQADSPPGADSDLVIARNEVFIEGTEPVPSSQGEPASEDPSNNETQPSAVSQTLNAIPQSQDRQSPEGDAAPATVSAPSQSPVETPPPEKNRPTALSVKDTPSGVLGVQTDPPGLEVLIDGKPAGASPVTLSLPVGEHTCKVIPPPGRAPVERAIQITTAAAETVNVRYWPDPHLRPPPGSLGDTGMWEVGCRGRHRPPCHPPPTGHF